MVNRYTGDDDGSFLPTRFPKKTGSTNERKMIEKAGGAMTIATVKRTSPDGTKTTLRTRGGNPVFRSTEPDAPFVPPVVTYPRDIICIPNDYETAPTGYGEPFTLDAGRSVAATEGGDHPHVILRRAVGGPVVNRWPEVSTEFALAADPQYGTGGYFQRGKLIVSWDRLGDKVYHRGKVIHTRPSGGIIACGLTKTHLLILTSLPNGTSVQLNSSLLTLDANGYVTGTGLSTMLWDSQTLRGGTPFPAGNIADAVLSKEGRAAFVADNKVVVVFLDDGMQQYQIVQYSYPQMNNDSASSSFTVPNYTSSGVKVTQPTVTPLRWIGETLWGLLMYSTAVMSKQSTAIMGNGSANYAAEITSGVDRVQLFPSTGKREPYVAPISYSQQATRTTVDYVDSYSMSASWECLIIHHVSDDLKKWLGLRAVAEPVAGVPYIAGNPESGTGVSVAKRLVYFDGQDEITIAEYTSLGSHTCADSLLHVINPDFDAPYLPQTLLVNIGNSGLQGTGSIVFPSGANIAGNVSSGAFGGSNSALYAVGIFPQGLGGAGWIPVGGSYLDTFVHKVFYYDGLTSHNVATMIGEPAADYHRVEGTWPNFSTPYKRWKVGVI